MHTSVAVASNSTIVRSSKRFSILRAYFSVLSWLSPALARRHAERLFTQPPHYAGRLAPTSGAKRDSVAAGVHSLAVWQAGPADAPAVLLAHGWGGRGAQMGSFVEPLLSSGYRVVWFDQPGHGESSGRAVALPDFVRAIEALSVSHGPFAAAIGHSLGAAALGLALRRGFRLGRIAFLSAPASLSEHTHNFARLLGLTPSIRESMRRRLERRYGMLFAEVDRIEDLAQLDLSALFLHDRYDAEVPYDHALRLSGRVPGARLITTYGLGHRRLLREPGVVQAVVNFLGSKADDPPVEIPVLPRPAPIY